MTAEIVDFKHRARIRPPAAPPTVLPSPTTGGAPRLFNPLTGWPVAGDGVFAAIDRVMRPHRDVMAAIEGVVPKLRVDPVLSRLSKLMDQNRKLIEGPLYVRT